MGTAVSPGTQSSTDYANQPQSSPSEAVLKFKHTLLLTVPLTSSKYTEANSVWFIEWAQKEEESPLLGRSVRSTVVWAGWQMELTVPSRDSPQGRTAQPLQGGFRSGLLTSSSLCFFPHFISHCAVILS